MGDTTKQQPQAGVSIPGGSAVPAPSMTPQQQMQLIQQLLPAAAKPAMMQAMALRAKNAAQQPPLTPGLTDTPTMDPSTGLVA